MSGDAVPELDAIKARVDVATPGPDADRAPFPPEWVDAVAQQVGETCDPERTEERRVRPLPRREDYATEDDWWEAKYETVIVPSPGADGSTLVAFRAEDGCMSIRPRTWREVVAEVLPVVVPLVRADEARRIAEKIENDNPRDGHYWPEWHDALRWAARIAREGSTG